MNQALLHIEDFKDLFTDIQSRRIFRDQKFFVDSIPKASVADILSAYHSEKGKDGFDLKAFYCQWFTEPDSHGKSTKTHAKNAQEHISQLWNALLRKPEKTGGTLIPLPFPFIAPGGRFSEIFYWDSYFTMLGLKESGRIDLIENIVDNFAYLIDTFGFIPNGSRSYFLSRSQPPFFALMVELLAEEKGENILVKYLPQMQKEYAFWMKGSDRLNEQKTSSERVVLMPGGEALNRYFDNLNMQRPESYYEDTETAKLAADKEHIYRNLRAGAESGWDYSSRWFAEANSLHSIKTTFIVPIDLNALMYKMEMLIASACLLAKNEDAARFASKAAERKKAIHVYLWSKERQTFVDYDLSMNKQSQALTAAMMYPLFLHIASDEQATSVANVLEEKLLKAGGIVTTQAHSGQQWDAPNGWAPLQWIAYKGLKNYGFNTLAKELKKRWIGALDAVFAATGKMYEKYNVEEPGLIASGGEYENQDGFGWTNGVYLAMLRDK